LPEDKYELPVVEARYQLKAVTADEHVAQALGVEAGSLVYLIERISCSEWQQPIDYESLLPR
jgi:GntR family transcriptional regulator